ncbi:MAG: hypothetical protein JWQ70_626 [Aeromicrobium sp.]|nr:hypothetical protein [Aeromicrobium sp.]
MRVPKVSLRLLFVGAASLVALVQLAAVTLAALPPNRYSEAVDPHTTYLNPYFTQNWRLFAPNPVAEDRSVLFQGSYVAADGTTKQTTWLNWTDVELDLIHHRLVGGRAGYVTNKLYSPLGVRLNSLRPAQRGVSLATDDTKPPSWLQLQKKLLKANDTPGLVTLYLRYERATARLATDALEARWPNRHFTAVRYELLRQGVVPYASRHGSAKERAASRPAPRRVLSGWRLPTPGDADERRAIADFYRRHR